MIYDRITTHFATMKDKQKKIETLESYENILLNIVSSIFDYEHEGINDYDFRFFELSLLAIGKVAVWKLDNKLVCTPCEFIGQPSYNGVGVDCMCYYVGGTKVFTNWQENEDIVVIFNNTIASSDYTVDRYANYLTEIDISAMACLKNTRYSSIIPVSDTKTKLAIEKALDNNEMGKPTTLLSQNVLDSIMSDSNGVKVLHLTDVKQSDKLQYITHFKDDILRQFFSLYGMSTNSTSKMAQQTIAEISDANNSSNILPYNMLYWRKKGIDKVNEVFGLNWKVTFSECWKRQQNEQTPTEQTPTEQTPTEQTPTENNMEGENANDTTN